MKPIRKNELEYLNQLIKDKFNDRGREIHSAIEAETQKQTDKNYKSFVEKLGIKTELKTFKDADNKLHKFKVNKDAYEMKLEHNQRTAINKLTEKLKSWADVRNWEDQYNDRIKFDIKEYDDVESILRSMCKSETKRAVEKLPKFKVQKELDMLEEQATNVLYSGRDIMEVWKYLGSTFKASGIPVAAPKSFLQIESK
jgi:hypothetical protein